MNISLQDIDTTHLLLVLTIQLKLKPSLPSVHGQTCSSRSSRLRNAAWSACSAWLAPDVNVIWHPYASRTSKHRPNWQWGRYEEGSSWITTVSYFKYRKRKGMKQILSLFVTFWSFCFANHLENTSNQAFPAKLPHSSERQHGIQCIPKQHEVLGCFKHIL